MANRAMSGRPMTTDSANVAPVTRVRRIGWTKYTKAFPLSR